MSGALGAEWEIVTTDPETEFERPLARISASTPQTSRPHGSRHRDISQSFQVVAWPTSWTATADAAMSEAQRVAGLLDDLLNSGQDTGAFRNGRRHPWRIPLYDYTDVPTGQAAPPTARCGFLRVTDAPSIDVIADPADATALAVVCDVRLAWGEGIATDPGPPVQTVTLTP